MIGLVPILVALGVRKLVMKPSTGLSISSNLAEPYTHLTSSGTDYLKCHIPPPLFS